MLLNQPMLYFSSHRDYMTSDYNDRGASAQQILSELSEIERELQLRKLLWESSDEWGNLVEDWTETQFDGLNVDVMQKNVSKFTQTVFMLEKGEWIVILLENCWFDIRSKRSVSQRS